MKRFLVLFVSMFVAGMIVSANVQAAPVDGRFNFKCPGFKGNFAGSIDTDTITTNGKIFTPHPDSKLLNNKKAEKNVDMIFLSPTCAIKRLEAPTCDTAQIAVTTGGFDDAESLNPITNACIANPDAGPLDSATCDNTSVALSGGGTGPAEVVDGPTNVCVANPLI